jgi:hypothetical protein
MKSTPGLDGRWPQTDSATINYESEKTSGHPINLAGWPVLVFIRKFECPKMAEDCLLPGLAEGPLTRKQTLKSSRPAAKIHPEKTLVIVKNDARKAALTLN